MIASLRQRLDGIGDSRRAGGHRQRRHAAFQRRNTLFQNILRGVCQSAIDISRVGKAETRRRMGGIPEHIGRGLVDRHGSCIGCGIGLLLAHVKL